MSYQDQLNYFRKNHLRAKEIESHDYWVAHSILQGIVERMNPSRCSSVVEGILYWAGTNLNPGVNIKSIVIPTLRDLAEFSVEVPVSRNLLPLNSRNLTEQQKQFAMTGNLSRNDIQSISRIDGYFGYISEVNDKGYRVHLLDKEDKLLLVDEVIPTTIFDAVRFPASFRDEGAGVCWVEYRFKDDNHQKKECSGCFEPASDGPEN